ncbi:hypothetical protein ACIBCM_30515 [Streptomyces sp. NPDC051018]|uniref:hypothetical protein n=1 Tax=Streptomyces sp. NPDC051018 TaxID=3365639 RepID=UPI00378DE200
MESPADDVQMHSAGLFDSFVKFADASIFPHRKRVAASLKLRLVSASFREGALSVSARNVGGPAGSISVCLGRALGRLTAVVAAEVERVG